MRRGKLAGIFVLACGFGIAAFGVPAIAQPKSDTMQKFSLQERKPLLGNGDFVVNTFAVGFTSAEPKNLNEVLKLIKAVGNQKKLTIVDATVDYFEPLARQNPYPSKGTGLDTIGIMPRVVLQLTSPKDANNTALSTTSLAAQPKVCGNLVKYFEVPDLAGPGDGATLLQLIQDLNTEIKAKFPEDVYVLEPETLGKPVQAATSNWAKPAVATATDPASASGVTVAVLDSGYNAMPGYTPAHSWNAVFRLPNGTPNPEFTSTDLSKASDNLTGPGTRGHGTGVASIIRGPDMIGGEPNTISLTSDAEIYPIKVCEDETCSSVSVAIGICRAASGIDGPANVINLSLAGAAKSWLVDGAIEDAVAANATVVAAAGNIKTDKVEESRWNETPGHYFFDYPLYPAALSQSVDGLISVGAAQQALGGFEWAVFSPKSPRWQLEMDQPRTVTNLHESIDLMAPGKYVLALPNDDKAPLTNVVGGTSFAAPFVSGAAAILLGQNPSLTPKQIEGLLIDAARSHPVDCPPGMCGAGMLNVQGALDLLDNPAYLAANGITP